MKTNRIFPAFTIIELLISIFIFTLLMAAVVTMVLGFYDLYNSQQAAINVGNGARALVAEVEKEGLQADHIVATHTFGTISYATDGTHVIFEIPSVNSSGDILTGSYDYVGVIASSTSAYSLTDAASGSARASGSRQLANGTLSVLSFTYDNVDLTKATQVTTDVITQAQVKQKTIQTELKSVVFLRNI